MRRSVLLPLVLFVSSAWPRAAPAIAQTGHVRWPTFARYGISFQYPVGWRTYDYAWSFSFSTLIAYVSNASLHDPCVRTPDSISCGLPLDRLPPGGVLVTWTANGFPGWTLRKQEGRKLTVDGRPSKLQIVHGRGTGCPAGTQENVGLEVARSAPDNWYGMGACLRGSRLKSLSADIMAMIRSVQVDS